MGEQPHGNESLRTHEHGVVEDEGADSVALIPGVTDVEHQCERFETDGAGMRV